MNNDKLSISVVIPTFCREDVLVDTIEHFLHSKTAPSEIVVVDQTPVHDPKTETILQELQRQQKIRWIRLSEPSIPRAMNVGLREARGNTVLFVDDDIIPGSELVAVHERTQDEGIANIVAGQVLQPWEQEVDTRNDVPFRFNSNRRRFITGLMAGNFSIKRDVALRLGGFDENFVRAAYRFETEFAERAVASGEKILFEPQATIRHLKEKTGGTRTYGEHLTTWMPAHSVGAYYYFLCSVAIRSRSREILKRLLGTIVTRHHLHRPWWIPVTFIAELLGLFWAVFLTCRRPKLISSTNGLHRAIIE
jgi:GT2 family glycosyltransferase